MGLVCSELRVQKARSWWSGGVLGGRGALPAIGAPPVPPRAPLGQVRRHGISPGHPLVGQHLRRGSGVFSRERGNGVLLKPATGPDLQLVLHEADQLLQYGRWIMLAGVADHLFWL